VQQRASVQEPVVRKKERHMTSMKTVTQKLRAWRRYRDTVRELSNLNDRELHDIGIGRDDIAMISRLSVAT
jgi:uncharacterized protein YjiS (DUF1127 family)